MAQRTARPDSPSPPTLRAWGGVSYTGGVSRAPKTAQRTTGHTHRPESGPTNGTIGLPLDGAFMPRLRVSAYAATPPPMIQGSARMSRPLALVTTPAPDQEQPEQARPAPYRRPEARAQPTARPRGATAAVVSGLARQREGWSTRRGEGDPNVVAAYDDAADAFEEYDSSLYEAFGEMTPLDIYGSDDDEGEDDEDGDDEDGDDEDDDVDADCLLELEDQSGPN